MPPTHTYLVTTATGAQGGSVARELRKAGHNVNIFVRDAAKPEAQALASLGCVIFVGDHSAASAEAIKKATAGVKGVFLNPAPNFVDPTSEAKQVQLFVDAAREAGTVESLVISTAVRLDDFADREGDVLTPFYRSKLGAEAVVRESGIKHWTLLRPPWLFHNFLTPHNAIHFPELATERIVRTMFNVDAPVAQFSETDIGPWTAAAFADPAKFHGKTIELLWKNATLRESIDEMARFAGVEIPIETVPIAFPENPTAPGSDMLMARAAFAIHQSENGGSNLALSEKHVQETASYGIPCTSWSEYLVQNKKRVFDMLKVQE